VATDPPADLTLTPLSGEARTLREWVTTFHLALVALDPYTSESAWILPTAGRIFHVFQGADCRVGFLMASDARDSRLFLGPYAQRFLTFVDPERDAIKALGLERLPALVHLNQDLHVAGAAEGWDPRAWRVITDRLGTLMSWAKPTLPDRGDPAPYEGSPALVERTA
jgi:hypothetical protein